MVLTAMNVKENEEYERNNKSETTYSMKLKGKKIKEKHTRKEKS